MFRKCFQLPVRCSNSIFLVKQPGFFEPRSNFLQKRDAGHSKWQNIKSTKEAADSNRASNFQRLTRNMQLAVKSGGDNPSNNPKLRSLMEEAQKLNMPKATIQKAIAAAKAQQLERPYWVVYKGPRGVLLGLEVTFANKNPTYLKTKLTQQTKKLNMKMEVHFQDWCLEKGVIVSKCLANGSYDKALEDALEIGADDVFENDDKTLVFECLPDRLDSVSSKLTSLGYEIEVASVELDFKEFVQISDEEKKDIETIVGKLQTQYDEVIRASYNAAT